MRRTLQRPFALAVVLGVSAALCAGEETTSKPAAGALFTAEAYIEHVKYLASDELAGRLPGSEGSELAARYIIERFRQAGCKPAGTDGSWFQPFEVSRGKRLVDEQALLEISGIDRKWEVRQDWIAFPFTALGDVEGSLAFAGYGIRAEEHEYDDYAGFDAEGKILLMLRYEPKAEDPEAQFGGETPSHHALFVSKMRKAARQGAQALLIVNPPNRDPDQDKLYEFNAFNSQQTYKLPMVHITRELADAILQQAGASDLKALQEKLDSERKPLSKDLGLTVKLHTGVEANTLDAKNILGMIPGDGSTEETIVIGAHRDHLGLVPRQFQRQDMTPMIHNGADDNASGSAALIELARALGAGPPLHRNVLFIAFDAEEMGLLGSVHFVRNPTIALEHIRAMVNFDMIGRLKQDKYSVFGIQSGKEFPALIEKHAEELSLKYKAPRGMMAGSDHSPFASRGIPAMFAFTGLHKQYHQPEDDWELIDGEGAARILQMWHPVLVELATMKEGPVYMELTGEVDEDVEVIRPAVEEQREAAEKEQASDDAREGAGAGAARRVPRVVLGIVPDMTGDDQPGLLVDSVIDGGAAKAAGMHSGDRILKIGDGEVRDIHTYMRAVREFKPGDVVDVVISRNGEQKTLKVKLQARKRRN